ncbi:MAG: TIR domain-containing protein [Candidatus Kryptoniota bacterium]
MSHIHEEAELARLFKDWIESTFAWQVEVFVSSDKRDIPVGTRWLPQISSALKTSGLFVMLCSAESLRRSWINFEAGCAWIKEVPLMLICHSGMQKDKLPSPMVEFQAIEINEDTFVNDFFESMRTHLKIIKLPRIDENAMRKELADALSSIEVTEIEPQKTASSNLDKISDEDALNILESWMGHRPANENTKVMKYSDVDAELDLPQGASRRLLEIAAQRWEYVIVRKTDNTILLKDAPDKYIVRTPRKWDLGF